MGLISRVSSRTYRNAIAQKVPAKMQFYIVRHGKTYFNERGIAQDQMYSPELNATGIAQAERLGKYLENTVFDHFICSDLKRTEMTMDSIRSGLLQSLTPITPEKLIRERSFGEGEGKPRDEVFKKLPKNAETKKQLKARAKDFIKKYTEELKDSNGKALVVSHGGFIKELLEVLLLDYQCDNLNSEDLVIAPNTSLTVIDMIFENGCPVFRCEQLYNVDH